MLKPCLLLILIMSLGVPIKLASQEIKTFGISDFGLRGNVKSCLVITDYGKEEYHFDIDGRLTKSITRFNDFDYEITYYKYLNDELIEKRVENYLDNSFDKATSIANFYEFDSVPTRKVTEKIVSYTKQLLEQNVYHYDSGGQLIKLTRTDPDGTDETVVGYDTIDGKRRLTHTLNGTPVKVINTWKKQLKDTLELTQKSVLKYFDGKRDTKSVEVYNANKMLVSKADSLFDGSTGKWIAQEKTDYTYNEKGLLSKTATKKGNFTVTKEYIYQFDGTENNNWVKEIVTPDNSYKTRRIKYFPVLEANDEP